VNWATGAVACLLEMLAVVGCGAHRETPRSPAIIPKRNDSGVFIAFMGETPIRRETFSIKRAGTHRVISARSTLLPSNSNGDEGELEIDDQFRPVRATTSNGVTYTRDDSPPTIEITRDDRGLSQGVVLTGPSDVFLLGPGLIAFSALCRVNGDVAWSMPRSSEVLEAYVADPVGAAKRVVMGMADEDYEILCVGDKLVAGGIARSQEWFVREGDEVYLNALKNAQRPPKHDWKQRQNPSEPWVARQTWLFDNGVIVTADDRLRMMRLTAFDARTGAEIKHRDFQRPLGAS